MTAARAHRRATRLVVVILPTAGPPASTSGRRPRSPVTWPAHHHSYVQWCRPGYSSEVQQHTLASASSGQRLHPALAGCRPSAQRYRQFGTKRSSSSVHSTCNSERQTTVTDGSQGSIRDLNYQQPMTAFTQVSALRVIHFAGGQGQDRTADLRLFRIRDGRVTGSMAGHLCCGERCWPYADGFGPR